jgi:hypothetical protein
MIKNILHTDMALHKNGLQQLAALPDSTREQPVAFATWSPDHRQVFNQVPPFLLLFFCVLILLRFITAPLSLCRSRCCISPT